MTGSAGLAAGHMQGLGICVAEAAGWPIQCHVGDIRHGIHMGHGIAFIDMTDPAIDIGRRCMGTHTASIVGLDGKGRSGMAALAFVLCTVIQLQAGVGACAAVTKGAGGAAGRMICPGLRMAEPAIHPVQTHTAEIRGHAGICRSQGMIQRIAFSNMAAVAFLIRRGVMGPDAAAVIGYNLENRLIMTGLALGLRAICKGTVNRMAEHAGLCARAVRGGDCGMTGQTGPVPDICNPVRMIRRVALTPCGCACGMAVHAVPAVRNKTGSPADILQGRKLRVAPDTRLIVAVDGEAVFRVA